MTLMADTIIQAQFVVKSNGKTYDFELGGYESDDAYDAAFRLISENPDVYKYLDEEYGWTADSESDVDDDMIEELIDAGLVEFNCQSIEFGEGSIFLKGELGFDGYGSYKNALEFLEECEDCTNEDAEKFYAMVEVAGTFNNLDVDDFDDCILIQASDEEELGRELVAMDFYTAPEDDKYFDYEALGHDFVEDGTFSETNYGYLMSP